MKHLFLLLIFIVLPWKVVGAQETKLEPSSPVWFGATPLVIKIVQGHRSDSKDDWWRFFVTVGDTMGSIIASGITNRDGEVLFNLSIPYHFADADTTTYIRSIVALDSVPIVNCRDTTVKILVRDTTTWGGSDPWTLAEIYIPATIHLCDTTWRITKELVTERRVK